MFSSTDERKSEPPMSGSRKIERESEPAQRRSASPSSRKKSKELTSTEWLHHCSAIQAKNATPELLAQAKARAERSSRLARHSRKAGKLQMSNALCQQTWNASAKEMRSAGHSKEMLERSSRNASERLQTVQRLGAIAAESDDDEEFEERTTNLSAQMGLALAAPVEAIEEEGQKEFQELLNELRIEPSDEAEQAAKFGLFTEYLGTVEQLRNETHSFFDECKEDFHASGRSDLECKIKKIDSQENMGVDFVEGRWFVYDMTKKAGDNCGLIGNVLALIKVRLELLARQDECPICLEEMDEGSEPHVLGCCHKVCKDCWQHWSQMQGHSAFCPLCRNEEFLHEILQRASILPSQ